MARKSHGGSCFWGKIVRFLIGMVLTVAAISPAGAGDRFDGKWKTVVMCENLPGTMGYVYKFDSVVKDSVLHGEKGTKGKAGWFQLDGKILPDGSADIMADGLVGASETAVGHRPAKTEYAYRIDAKFSGDSGTGKRVEGRACAVTFAREH